MIVICVQRIFGELNIQSLVKLIADALWDGDLTAISFIWSLTLTVTPKINLYHLSC